MGGTGAFVNGGDGVSNQLRWENNTTVFGVVRIDRYQHIIDDC